MLCNVYYKLYLKKTCYFLKTILFTIYSKLYKLQTVSERLHTKYYIQCYVLYPIYYKIYVCVYVIQIQNLAGLLDYGMFPSSKSNPYTMYYVLFTIYYIIFTI